MKPIRYGSICSGIEAATVAWHPLGWAPAFFAEIEPFPSAVLAHHYPDVPNLGDMTSIDGEVWRRRIDLLVGGTPCQAFSVAGKRESLSDDRGNLTLKFVELVHAADPRWVVWENVPGVLSTKDNAFGCFLAGLVGEGQPLVCRDNSWPNAGMVVGPRRSAAWRVLDAQYFGLAQRRRRVFVVSCRTRDGINPGAVLFEPESVRRDTPPSREAGARVAASLTRGADSGGKGGYAGWRREDDSNIVNCLDSHMGSGGPDDNAAQAGHLIPDVIGTLNANGKAAGSATQQDAESGMLVTHSLRADGFDASEDGTGRGTPLVPVAFGWNKSPSQTMRVGEIADGLQASPTSNPAVAYGVRTAQTSANGHGVAEDLAHTLDRANGQAVAFAQNQRDEIREMDVAGALAAEPGMKQQTYIAFQERGREGGRSVESQADLAYSLNAPSGGGRRQEMNVASGMAVRRLTPRECERLQGFPTCTDRTIIDVCLDLPSNAVHVALKCHRWLNNASPADADGSDEFARFADASLRSDRDVRESLVAAHVRMSFAPTVVAISSHGRFIWRASGAGRKSSFPRYMQPGLTALAIAAVAPGLVRLIPDGRAASRQSTRSFTTPLNGSSLAGMCGQGSEDGASGADNVRIAAMKFITSNLGPDTDTSGWSETTLLSFVVNAMTLCIPEGTRPASSYRFVVDLEGDYTLIPYRGKPAADGPRYRALGNSMAVPVMRWIGERLAKVEAVAAPHPLPGAAAGAAGNHNKCWQSVDTPTQDAGVLAGEKGTAEDRK